MILCPLPGLGLSQDVAGATFMAAGSSAPELVTAFLGNPQTGTVTVRVMLSCFPILFVSDVLYVHVRCVCDEGGHRHQHHSGVGGLQSVRNLCCVRTVGHCGSFWHLTCIRTETQRNDVNLFVSVSICRQDASPAGLCSGTAWHTASVLPLLLPSFMTTKCTGGCLLTQRDIRLG